MKTQWLNNWSFWTGSVTASYRIGEKPWRSSSQPRLWLFETCWKNTDRNQISTVRKNKQANIKQGEVNLKANKACIWTQRSWSNLIEDIWHGQISQICFALAVRWGKKDRNPLREKSPKCHLGRISGINWIPTTGKPTKCFGKPSNVSVVKYLILVDPSKTNMVTCLLMRSTSLADGESVSRILKYKKLSHHRTHTGYIWRRKTPSMQPKSS